MSMHIHIFIYIAVYKTLLVINAKEMFKWFIKYIMVMGAKEILKRFTKKIFFAYAFFIAISFCKLNRKIPWSLS